MEPLIGEVRSLGYWSVPLNAPVRSQPFPISPFAPWFIMEVVFAPPHIPSMMSWYRHKPIGLFNHGLEALKLEGKINLISLYINYLRHFVTVMKN